ncbi:cell wall-binding repeat-containing protein [Candidatus Poriferisodalis sp.]|uniref:cell wall-binding repeat-containing protein n=1 Tax=Candidatus Poriferisodalis sp. TaxID=3101277 RepID=UPI003B52F810
MPIRSSASRAAGLVLVLVVAVALVPLPGAGAAPGDPEIERLEGPDRYATSLAVARRFAQEAGGALDSAVLVAGTSWPDAVVAAGLAGSLDAPVLLASPQGLSADALRFLADTQVSTVVAIAAAGTANETALRSVLGSLPSSVTDTELIGGNDAPTTSVAVAKRIENPGVMPAYGRTAIVANSTVFADALVAGPFAARGAHPVLLTPRDTLHTDVAAYIRTQGVLHVVIMGGTAAISAGVERDLASLGPQITRLGGATRFGTATATADFVQAKYSSTAPRCFDRSTAGLATARVPFDSFSAAPLLARLCAPLLLTDRDQPHPTTAQWLRTSTEHIIVLGGPAAVSPTAIDAYLNAGEPAPDLVVGTPTVDVSAPVAGARFTLSATVRNQGSGPSASTTLRYYRSADPTITTADTPAGTDSVFRLDAQESGAESIRLTAPPTPGTYYYGACVDSTSDESDTTNNCSTAVTVTVGAATAPDTERPGSAPAAPTSVRATWSWTAMVLVWDAVPEASHYKVYHDDAYSSNCNIRFGSASYCDELASSVTGTRYDHLTPDPYNNYYWVVACNDSECSTIDSDHAIQPNNPRSGRIRPVARVLQRATSHSLSLAIYSLSEGIRVRHGVTHYELSRSTHETLDYSVVDSNVAGGLYVDSDLEPSTTYYYMVRACNNADCSRFLPASGGVTEADREVSVPPPPQGLGGEKVDLQLRSDDARIWWDPVIGATYYQIYQSGFNNQVIDFVDLDGVVVAPRVSYYDSDPNHIFLVGFTTTVYSVAACNQAGCSELSEPVSIY